MKRTHKFYMNTNNISIRKLLIPLLVLFVFVIPLKSKAFTINQNVHNATYTQNLANSAPFIIQDLGQGLSGNLKYIEINAQASSTDTHNLQAFLYECPAGTSQFNFAGCTQKDSSNKIPYSDFYSSITTLTFNFASTTFHMDSSKFYSVLFAPDWAGIPNITVEGSLTDLYNTTSSTGNENCVKYNGGTYVACGQVVDLWFNTSTLTQSQDDDTSTHIIQITPANNAIITPDVSGLGATTTIEVVYYINPDDVEGFRGISIWVNNVNQNTIYGLSNTSDYTFIWTGQSDPDLLPTEAGQHTFTYTVWLPNGGYAIHARMQNNFMGMVNPFTSAFLKSAESQDNSVPTAQYHYYQVGTGTFLSNLRQGAGNQLENILSATTTSSSTPSIADCKPLDFDFGKCMSITFVPSGKDLKDFGSVVSTGMLSKFPLGYVWNFYQILLSTSTRAIPLISAKMPQAMAGQGAQLDLAINANTLDFVWNATTSAFLNVSAPDTRTFEEIVGDYWNIVVYISIGLYLLMRIMGSGIIGSWFKDERMTYRMRKRQDK